MSLLERFELATVTAYDGELVARLAAVLDQALVGLYAAGSWVLGDYVHGRSDLDRFAVVEAPIDGERKQAVVDAVRHEALPCPARGLELVVYARGAVAAASSDAAFELNLNTGPRMPLHVAVDPAGEPRHWFVIDRAIAREHARPLHGPPARELIAPLPRSVVIAALGESLRWHAEHGAAAAENAVLNACRAWRYAVEGTWSSKRDAARWAQLRLDDPRAVDAALARRYGDRPYRADEHAAAALLERVRSVLA
jgi:Aminoglycoside adenylyltransferase, C-terminal domain